MKRVDYYYRVKPSAVFFVFKSQLRDPASTLRAVSHRGRRQRLFWMATHCLQHWLLMVSLTAVR
jgi:hypothetical protein